MGDLNELKPVGKLNPFAKFCCTIGNLPTSYMISLTYEEQLLWLCNYLEKTVIPAVNTNAEAVQELQELYLVLKNYVDQYFENLDVQDEINNKLDEMAKDGTLTNLIKNYVDPIQENFENKINNSQENFENKINNSIENITTRLNSIASGSPLVASSVSEMTNTNRVYVNTTDGHWYFYNGTIWKDGGVYQATVPSDGSYNEINIPIFSINKNKTLDKTGTLQNNTSFDVSDFINIENHSKLDIYCCGYGNNIIPVVFYDTNKDFISYVNRENKPNTIQTVQYGSDYTFKGILDIPSNAKYMRITTNYNLMNNKKLSEFYLYLIESNLENNLENNVFNKTYFKNLDIIKNVLFDYIYEKPQMTYPTTASALNFDGSITKNNSFFISDYIDLTDAEKIKFYGHGYYTSSISLCPIAFYDSSKTFLFATDIRSLWTNQRKVVNYNSTDYYMEAIIDIPQNAKYARVQGHTSLTHHPYIYLIKNLDKYIDLSNTIINNQLFTPNINEWSNKKCCFIGDSITQGTGTTTGNRYYDYLQILRNIIPVHYAVGGYKMIDCYSLAQQMFNDQGQNLDAIFIFAGTNDFFGNTPLGEWYTETQEEIIINSNTQATTTRTKRNFIINDTTFKGAINKILSYLKEKYPTKQIIIMTPIHRGYAKFSATNIQYDELYQNGIGLYFEDYINTILEVGKIYSVPVIDLYHNSGLFPLDSNYAQYFANSNTDMLHPNALGHQRIAQTIDKNLNPITPNFRVI